MSVVLAIIMAIGVLANVVGALAVIVPCVAVLGFVTWVLLDANDV